MRATDRAAEPSPILDTLAHRDTEKHKVFWLPERSLSDDGNGEIPPKMCTCLTPCSYPGGDPFIPRVASEPVNAFKKGDILRFVAQMQAL